ncbi:hypothetical protein [Trinickia sp. EG282A]|uniref:hypothetical protein n=1 Tax=Trinickia sp. EG282A TaxID=3237013 RepID=UPI0034D256EA
MEKILSAQNERYMSRLRGAGLSPINRTGVVRCANGVQDNTQDGKNLGTNLICVCNGLKVGYGFNNSHYYIDGAMTSLKAVRKASSRKSGS